MSVYLQNLVVINVYFSKLGYTILEESVQYDVTNQKSFSYLLYISL